MTENLNLQLKIITPDGIIFDQEIKQLSMKSLTGTLTILKKHSSTIGGIINDVIRIMYLDNSEEEYICGEGLYCISDNILRIIVSFCLKKEKENIDNIIDEYKKNEKILNINNENHISNDEGFKIILSMIQQLKKIKI